jgi:hypothetical protein
MTAAFSPRTPAGIVADAFSPTGSMRSMVRGFLNSELGHIVTVNLPREYFG